jgi:choline dehydrogenase-like flavoprotein
MMSSATADVVIIGGGTAGLALAARLSEDPTIQVIVLEAGQDQKDDPRVKTPALWPGLLGTEADWGFVTVPQVRHYPTASQPYLN